MMEEKLSPERIIAVVGPTASGKTALAVGLAERFNGEVISADSMQLYRGMDIGTAKVTPEETRGIPHHMIDVADPGEAYSVSRYVQEADPILQDILSRGKTAVIAGGTGLYVDALISGREFAPYPSTGKREELERQADAAGMEAMLERLREIDPDSAARLHPADRKRILRALEVYEETGMTITAHNLATQAIPDRHRPIWLGIDFPDRAELYRRIDLRVGRMLELGLRQELESLLASGLTPGSTALQAIGYKEFLPALRGETDWDAAADKVRQESRRYAKRQLTWFRRNKQIHWLMRGTSSPDETLLREAEAICLESWGL